jgi:hypothetical protein
MSKERIEINEYGSNIPETLMSVFNDYNEDADPYKEAERGYDFDYGLSGEPTHYWKLK